MVDRVGTDYDDEAERMHSGHRRVGLVLWAITLALLGLALGSP